MSEPAEHLHWGAEALWQRLDPLLPGLSVEVVARCESTNTQLLERARQSSGRHDQPITVPDMLETMPAPLDDPTPHGRRAVDTQPCLLVAEQQTRGRGRQGRTWQSTAGASLTFSLSLALRPREWSGLSLAVGVALAEALDPQGGLGTPRIGLKWPNDLWLLDAPIGAPARGRKLGGVLIETVAVGARRMAVVGVGLNVQPQPLRDLSTGFACLQELQPGIDAPQALAQVAEPLALALLQFEHEGFEAFAERYRRRDLLRGQALNTTSPGAATGIAAGIAEDGSLLVQVGRELMPVSSAEVSVRLDADGA